MSTFVGTELEYLKYIYQDDTYDRCPHYSGDNEPCYSQSEYQTGYPNSLCSLHQDSYNPDTYDEVLGEFIKYDTSYCTRNVKEYLDCIEGAQGFEAKCELSVEMFDFLCWHRSFVYRNPVFAQSMFDKLIEFTKFDDFPVKHFMLQLFPKYT